ncbi:MAG: hypothetical protein IPM68_03960 [Flavobacteriales bacterium]|nr:hypothetical protein [Flavobacteriales bacterium]
MVPSLEDDLRNIAEWAEAAARHHGNGLPREALMHGRNIGEAASRVIIRMAWPGRRGEDELQLPQFDLLLRTIQNKALAPPDIVSALHVLRTRGNNALHGKAVSTSDSAGALFMSAEALLAHLYGALQHRPVPASVAGAIDQALGGRAEHDHREALRDMLREVLREEVRDQPPTPIAPALDPATVRRMEAEQEEHRARILDMEQLVRQVAARGAEPPASEHHAALQPARESRAGWWVAATVLAVLATTSLLIIAPWESGTRASLPVADSTVTTVLILPFALMQDDPNLNLRFEQATAERLRTRIREGDLAMRVFLADTVIGTVPPDDTALAIARRHHADVVFYGELFEPTSADSGRVHPLHLHRRWPLAQG